MGALPMVRRGGVAVDTASAVGARIAETMAPLVIRRIDAIPVAIPLTKPVKMTGVTIAHADNLIVRIEAANGAVGWGEAPSAPTMTGDTLGGLVAAVEERLAAVIVGQDARFRPALVARMAAALYGNTGARSAVEMALADLAGRVSGLPLADLLGGPQRASVRPLWLLGNATIEQDVAEAGARRAEGYRFFKLKVGVKRIEDDIAATLAVRDALGPDILLCADANTGFSRAGARRYLDGIQSAKLFFLEQPLRHDDLAGMAMLARASAVAIGADEGIHSLHDLDAHAAQGAASGVSLKFIKLGGLAALLKAATVCELRGLSVNVAGKMAESGIGSAAIVHAACVVPEADWGISATHPYLAEDLVRTKLRLDADGAIALPTGGGLGVEVDEQAVERFRVR
jgi:muconate cycloisomerase